MIKRREKRKYGRIIFVLAIFFLFLLLVAGIILSPVFKVKEVIVYGNKKTSSEEIKTGIKPTNILLLTTNELKKDLLKNFPNIAQAKIEKNIPKRTITITVIERESLGIVCKENTGNCFYIDKNGIIFEDAPQTSGSLVLLIKDFSPEEFSLGRKIFEEQTISSIVEIRENLNSSTNIKTDWFESRIIPPKELKLVTSKGWYILFDSTRDIKKQLSILKTALSEKIKTTDNLEYIDLRIENRIYYK